MPRAHKIEQKTDFVLLNIFLSKNTQFYLELLRLCNTFTLRFTQSSYKFHLS